VDHRPVVIKGEISRRLRGEDSATGREVCWSDDVRNDDVFTTFASSHPNRITTRRSVPERREGLLTQLSLELNQIKSTNVL